ncbi:MAG TPA: hypothetical protein VK879_08040 [Candidatus Sulfomarinibacteraceae bacterium]|nr:hypothetical protein [Candidatus Sulfomarinibacteraceae bacterium]
MTQELAQIGERETPTGQMEAGDRVQILEVDLARAVRLGALGALTVVFISAIGMIEAFVNRTIVQPSLSLSYVAMFLVPVVFGYLAGKSPKQEEGRTRPAAPGLRNVLAGLIAGAISGLGIVVLVLLASNFDLRSIFIAISPRLLNILTFNRELLPGLAFVVAGSALVGTLSGSAALVPEKWREPLVNAVVWTLLVGLLQSVFQQLLNGLRLTPISQFLFSPLGGLTPVGTVVVFALFGAIYWAGGGRNISVRERYETLPQEKKRTYFIVGAVVLLVVLFFLPRIAGVFLSEVLDIVGIFLMMGLGLNLVVGFAGLLDLGYVAFFAVGAYMTAILTSPGSPAFSPELSFWAALPFVIIAAAIAGIIVGTPVLRMRGDYLAIVTLGFGEIARLLFVSEALFPYVGGAQGIISIPTVSIGRFAATSSTDFFYPIAGFVLLAVYATWALENSRIGRAWKAMREDESVAEVMGIDTVQIKLAAFIMGAIIASFGGALFAAKIGSVFPHSFNIIVSIQVLVLIIVGGMGSIPGVIVGAIVIIGLPELLREFSEFKFLLYGALLIYMMLNKPEGFVPSRERMRELHQEEMMQDAWLDDEESSRTGPPAPAAGPDTA